MEQKPNSFNYVTACTLFSVCLIASNMLEIKVVGLGQLTVTAGMLVFPISYMLNDCMVEVWGLKAARRAIWLGFAMDFIVMALGGLAVLLPSPDYWDGAAHFNYMFSLAPRMVAASLTAFLAGSMLNALVMDRLKKAQQGRHFSVRAVASTVVGETADSFIFFPIAFAGVLPTAELFKMIAVQTVFKTMVEVILLPVTKTVVKRLKEAE